MEKIIALSQADRIKKAEEIYLRRKYNSLAGKTINPKPKAKYKIIKKTCLQLLICTFICFGIYETNKRNIAIDSIEYIKKTLQYDEDFEKWINKIRNVFLINSKSNEELIQNSIQENNIEEDNSNKAEEIVNEADNASKISQDAQYIKDNFLLIKPVEGEISSRFGPRNPTTETVPKYHTGIDIAVPEGTTFVSSMDGVVDLVSSKGDYRKSYKNNK